MKVFTFIVLMSLLLIPAFLCSSEARLKGMGDAFSLIEDETDVLLYPHLLNQYDNQAGINLISEDYDFILTHEQKTWNAFSRFKLKKLNMAVFLNQRFNQIGINDFDIENAPNSFNFRNDLCVKNMIMISKGNFGVAFGFKSDFIKTKEEGNSESYGYHLSENNDSDQYQSLLFSRSFKNTLLSIEISSAKYYEKYTVQNDPEEIEKQHKSIQYILSSRSVLKETDEQTLLLNNKFLFSKPEWINDAIDSDYMAHEYNCKIFSWSLDTSWIRQKKDNYLIFINVKPVELNWKNKVYSDHSNDDEKIFVYSVGNINCGVEKKLNNYLSARMGSVYSKRIFSSNANSVNQFTKYSIEKLDANMGLGFMYKDIQIDMVINDGLLFDGPAFVGGKSNKMTRQINFSWNF